MKKFAIFLIISVLCACQASKNSVKFQIKTLKKDLATQWKIIGKADQEKMDLVNILTKKLKKIPNFDQKRIDSLVISQKKVFQTQLTQEKMYHSENIDQYDLATSQMLSLINKIDVQNQKEITEIIEKIIKIDENDLPRRINYDDSARAWNLICQTQTQLKKVALFALNGE